VAETRILSIVGCKNAGKTTLAVALASEYVRKGRRVMAIKHSTHPLVDKPGSDSYRLFHEGKAQRVILAAPDGRVLFERQPDNYDPVGLAREYLGGADLVLVEGYRSADLPKIEVFRRDAGDRPLYQPDAADAHRWLAIVTDDEHFEATCPVLRFRDTMWLQLLATLAWDKARVI
jgi:molybdopterin-guanine dinucleotide biosynthesis protein B